MRPSARARRKIVEAWEFGFFDGQKRRHEWRRNNPGQLLPTKMGFRLALLRGKFPGGVMGELMARPLRDAARCLLGNDDLLTAPFEYKVREHKVHNYFANTLAMARKGSAKEFAEDVKAAIGRRYQAEYAGLTVDEYGCVSKLLWAEMVGNQIRCGSPNLLEPKAPDPMETD